MLIRWCRKGERLTLDDHDAPDFFLGRCSVAAVASGRHADAVGDEVLLGVRLAHGSLEGDDDLGPLLHPLLLALLDDERVRVAHHGDQHVEQQDGHHDHEDDEHDLGHRRVHRVA